MNKSVRMTALASLGVATLALSACAGSAVSGGSDEAAPSGGPATIGEAVESVLIGSLHPTSGALTADGQQMQNAMELAIDAVNEGGGIEALGGADLELAAADTQGAAEIAQSEATRLIEEGAVVLVGTYQSGAAANVAAVAERNQVPFVMDVAALDDILDQGHTYSFRLQPNASAMGTQGAESVIALAEAAGTPITRIAYLYEQSNFGQAAFAAFTAEAEAAGITVDPAISYDATFVSDLTTQVQQVAASGAEVLAVSGYYRDGVLLSQAVNTVAPELQAVFGVANGAFDQPQFVADAPNRGEGYLDANYHWDVTNPDSQALAELYRETYNEEIRTSAVLAYDAVMMVAEALEESGSTDPTVLRDAIAGTSYEPLVVSNGPVSFDEDGENTNAAIVTMQVQNGAIRQVFPDDVAEIEPVYPAAP